MRTAIAMVGDPGALTVADLMGKNDSQSNLVDDIDDSTAGCADTYDDDSFLANNSLCRQHRSAIQMLDSLRREVVEMTRGDGKSITPNKSPQDVTIDLTSGSTELSSPLASPVLSRPLTVIPPTDTLVPLLNNHDNKTPHTAYTSGSDSTHLRHFVNSDDSTFCSMDHSLNNEMNILKAAAKDLERELKAEDLNTVYEAIARIGKSDGPTNPRTHSEPCEEQSNELQFLGGQILDIYFNFFRSLEIDSVNFKIMIASILVYLIQQYIF